MLPREPMLRLASAGALRRRGADRLVAKLGEGDPPSRAAGLRSQAIRACCLAALCCVAASYVWGLLSVDGNALLSVDGDVAHALRGAPAAPPVAPPEPHEAPAARRAQTAPPNPILAASAERRKAQRAAALVKVRHTVRGENIELRLGTAVIGQTATPYICAALDWWPAEKCDHSGCPWVGSSVLGLDLGAESPTRHALVRAMRALGPMALRVGGSLQDLVSYDVPGATRSGTEFSECNADFLLNEPDRVGFRGACLRAAAYDQIDSMAREAGAPMIFGISALHGRERNPAVKDAGCEKCTATPCEPCWTGRWNPVAGGARALLDHIYRRAQSNESALAAFSLGNELCGIGGIAAHLPPEQVGDDFARFSGVVDQVWGNQRSKTLVMPPAIGLSRPLIVGPDCQLPLDSVQGWYSRFFPNGGAALDAFSYHLYWLGSSATWGRVKRKMLDRDFSASFKDDELSRGDLWPLSRAFFSTINEYDYIAKVGAPQAQIWVSEAGGAYGSGAPNITDRFLSAFWYLDELGEMAKTSTSLHCRQTLVGGRYGLLQWNDGVLVPNPDYFATRLWNELMGERALKAVLVNLAAPGSAPAANSAPALDEQRAGDVRAYAHCRRAGAGAAGDVVVLVINSSSRRARKLKLRQAGVSALARLPRVEFHVQPPADASGNPDVGGFAALLNGVPLDDVEAPLVGLRANGDSDVVVAPLSYAFIAFEGANWPACLEPEAETSSNTYRFPPRAAGARPRRPRPPPPAAAAPAPAKAPKLAKAPPPPPPSPKRGQKRQEKPRDRVKERVRSRRRITKAPNR